MQKIGTKAGIILVAGLLGLVGCTHTGMSVRETPGNNLNSFVNALYDPGLIPEGTPAAAPLKFPIRLGVVQVGEVSPPQAMMDEFGKHHELFASVQSISAVGSPNGSNGYNQENSQFRQQNAVQEQIRRIREVSHDMGLTHVLLIGGTIDQARSSTGLSLLDLTIVGYFVVPSQKIVADAKGGAYLIDVATGRVVLSASADKRASTMTSSADTDRGSADQLLDVRASVMNDLTANFITDCTNHTNPTATALVPSAQPKDLK